MLVYDYIYIHISTYYVLSTELVILSIQWGREGAVRS